MGTICQPHKDEEANAVCLSGGCEDKINRMERVNEKDSWKFELIQENDEIMKQEMSKISQTVEKVTAEAPAAYHCGYRELTSTASNPIYFDSMFYSRTNQPSGGLEISSGLYTAPFPGTYKATYSLYANEGTGQKSLHLHLRKNGEKIEESQHLSLYAGTAGEIDDQGGRTLITSLGRGDTLDMFCEDCSAGVGHIL